MLVLGLARAGLHQLLGGALQSAHEPFLNKECDYKGAGEVWKVFGTLAYQTLDLPCPSVSRLDRAHPGSYVQVAHCQLGEGHVVLFRSELKHSSKHFSEHVLKGSFFTR